MLAAKRLLFWGQVHSSTVGSFQEYWTSSLLWTTFVSGPLCHSCSSILPFCFLISFLLEIQIPTLMLLGGRNAASSLSACILARLYPFQLLCNPLGLQLWCSVGETAFRFAGVFEEQCENVSCNRILNTSTCCLCRQFNFFFVLLC